MLGFCEAKTAVKQYLLPLMTSQPISINKCCTAKHLIWVLCGMSVSES